MNHIIRHRHRRWLVRGLLGCVLALVGPTLGATETRADFEAALAGLDARDFADKLRAIAEVARSGDPRSETVLAAMLDGRLAVTRAGGRLVVLPAEHGDAVDVRSGAPVPGLGARQTSRVRINNRLRGVLRDAIASLRLASPDRVVRLDAARALVGGVDASSLGTLRDALEAEGDAEVRGVLEVALAMAEARSDDVDTRLAAVRAMAGSLRPEVRGLLREMGDEERESDPRVRSAARDALDAIEAEVALYGHLSSLYFGVSLGSVLLLAAVGLAITFGVMGVINMAHGEMVMLGAYTTYVVQTLLPDALEISLLVALPLAFLVAGLVGVLMERGIIRHLYGRPLETLLATFGVSLVLQQTVRTVFSPLNRSVSTPQWMSGALEINPVLAFTYNRLYIIAFSIMVLLALVVLLRRTRFGLEMRAVTQNRAMASAMGIRTSRVDAMTFGLGCGIAGLAGVALSQLTNVGPNMGQAYIVDSFMVVVFGGVGNLLGTFVGAMTLGIVSKLLEPATGTVLAKILVLVSIIVFIQRRPRGLFALSGRAAEA